MRQIFYYTAAGELKTDPNVAELKTAVESQATISPSSSAARASPSALFPVAVGPTTAISFFFVVRAGGPRCRGRSR